jgi:hypothetical protein
MSEAQFIETIIGVGILLFAAKLMAELFLRLKLPIVLGELMENNCCKLMMKSEY